VSAGRRVRTLSLHAASSRASEAAADVRWQLGRNKTTYDMVGATSNRSDAVQKWEIGEKKPSGPSLKLLNVIDKKGVDALV